MDHQRPDGSVSTRNRRFQCGQRDSRLPLRIGPNAHSACPKAPDPRVSARNRGRHRSPERRPVTPVPVPDPSRSGFHRSGWPVRVAAAPRDRAGRPPHGRHPGRVPQPPARLARPVAVAAAREGHVQPGGTPATARDEARARLRWGVGGVRRQRRLLRPAGSARRAPRGNRPRRSPAAPYLRPHASALMPPPSCLRPHAPTLTSALTRASSPSVTRRRPHPSTSADAAAPRGRTGCGGVPGGGGQMSRKISICAPIEFRRSARSS